MRKMTVDQARDDFDALIEAAGQGPVGIVQDEQGVAVVLSPEVYARLSLNRSGVPRPELERLLSESIKRHDSVYRALAKWEGENEPPDGEMPSR